MAVHSSTTSSVRSHLAPTRMAGDSDVDIAAVLRRVAELHSSLSNAIERCLRSSLPSARIDGVGTGAVQAEMRVLLDSRDALEEMESQLEMFQMCPVTHREHALKALEEKRRKLAVCLYRHEGAAEAHGGRTHERQVVLDLLGFIGEDTGSHSPTPAQWGSAPSHPTPVEDAAEAQARAQRERDQEAEEARKRPLPLPPYTGPVVKGALLPPDQEDLLDPMNPHALLSFQGSHRARLHPGLPRRPSPSRKPSPGSRVSPARSYQESPRESPRAQYGRQQQQRAYASLQMHQEYHGAKYAVQGEQQVTPTYSRTQGKQGTVVQPFSGHDESPTHSTKARQQHSPLHSSPRHPHLAAKQLFTHAAAPSYSSASQSSSQGTVSLGLEQASSSSSMMHTVSGERGEEYTDRDSLGAGGVRGSVYWDEQTEDDGAWAGNRDGLALAPSDDGSSAGMGMGLGKSHVVGGRKEKGSWSMLKSGSAKASSLATLPCMIPQGQGSSSSGSPIITGSGSSASGAPVGMRRGVRSASGPEESSSSSTGVASSKPPRRERREREGGSSSSGCKRKEQVHRAPTPPQAEEEEEYHDPQEEDAEYEEGAEDPPFSTPKASFKPSAASPTTPVTPALKRPPSPSRLGASPGPGTPAKHPHRPTSTPSSSKASTPRAARHSPVPQAARYTATQHGVTEEEQQEHVSGTQSFVPLAHSLSNPSAGGPHLRRAMVPHHSSNKGGGGRNPVGAVLGSLAVVGGAAVKGFGGLGLGLVNVVRVVIGGTVGSAVGGMVNVGRCTLLLLRPAPLLGCTILAGAACLATGTPPAALAPTVRGLLGGAPPSENKSHAQGNKGKVSEAVASNAAAAAAAQIKAKQTKASSPLSTSALKSSSISSSATTTRKAPSSFTPSAFPSDEAYYSDSPLGMGPSSPLTPWGAAADTAACGLTHGAAACEFPSSARTPSSRRRSLGAGPGSALGMHSTGSPIFKVTSEFPTPTSAGYAGALASSAPDTAKYGYGSVFSQQEARRAASTPSYSAEFGMTPVGGRTAKVTVRDEKAGGGAFASVVVRRVIADQPDVFAGRG